MCFGNTLNFKLNIIFSLITDPVFILGTFWNFLITQGSHKWSLTTAWSCWCEDNFGGWSFKGRVDAKLPHASTCSFSISGFKISVQIVPENKSEPEDGGKSAELKVLGNLHANWGKNADSHPSHCNEQAIKEMLEPVSLLIPAVGAAIKLHFPEASPHRVSFMFESSCRSPSPPVSPNICSWC